VDDSTRNFLADSLDALAEQRVWNGALWQRCYDLVRANTNDKLVRYMLDDLIHYSGRPLFRAEPRPKDLQRYAQEFRDFATALRGQLSLSEYKARYE
jgi:hypothetical protein